MLRVAVVSITYRTLNNIAPVLQAMLARGDRCEVIWAPTSQHIEGQSPHSYGLPVGVEHAGVGAKTPQGQLEFGAVSRRYLDDFQPDLVLSDDMTTWPNRIVHQIVRTLAHRPWHLAWQHGVHQPWYEMRQRFDADLFLCYGRLQAFLLGAPLAARVLPVGLPKLDRLVTVDAAQDRGYLCWFAQPLPEARLQVELLADVANAAQLPVHIRPHPAAPLAFAPFGNLSSRGLQIDDPACDPIDSLRGCRSFASMHSSAVLEALLLGKPGLLFPSFGLTSFPGYPNVATDFTARAYLVAMKYMAARRDATEAFLVDCIGGRRFDHTVRSLHAIDTLADWRRRGMRIEQLESCHVEQLCAA